MNIHTIQRGLVALASDIRQIPKYNTAYATHDGHLHDRAAYDEKSTKDGKKPNGLMRDYCWYPVSNPALSWFGSSKLEPDKEYLEFLSDCARQKTNGKRKLPKWRGLLWWGFAGSWPLVAPMLLMKLPQTLFTDLPTTGVSVMLFAFCVATAAYHMTGAIVIWDCVRFWSL